MSRPWNWKESFACGSSEVEHRPRCGVPREHRVRRPDRTRPLLAHAPGAMQLREGGPSEVRGGELVRREEEVGFVLGLLARCAFRTDVQGVAPFIPRAERVAHVEDDTPLTRIAAGGQRARDVEEPKPQRIPEAEVQPARLTKQVQ